MNTKFSFPYVFACIAFHLLLSTLTNAQASSTDNATATAFFEAFQNDYSLNLVYSISNISQSYIDFAFESLSESFSLTPPADRLLINGSEAVDYNNQKTSKRARRARLLNRGLTGPTGSYRANLNVVDMEPSIQQAASKPPSMFATKFAAPLKKFFGVGKTEKAPKPVSNPAPAENVERPFSRSSSSRSEVNENSPNLARDSTSSRASSSKQAEGSDTTSPQSQTPSANPKDPKTSGLSAMVQRGKKYLQELPEGTKLNMARIGSAVFLASVLTAIIVPVTTHKGSHSNGGALEDLNSKLLSVASNELSSPSLLQDVKSTVSYWVNFFTNYSPDASKFCTFLNNVDLVPVLHSDIKSNGWFVSFTNNLALGSFNALNASSDALLELSRASGASEVSLLNSYAMKVNENLNYNNVSEKIAKATVSSTRAYFCNLAQSS